MRHPAALGDETFDLERYQMGPGDETHGWVYTRGTQSVVVRPLHGLARLSRCYDNYKIVGDHPAIINFLGFADVGGTEQKIVLEHAPNGNLLKILRQVWSGRPPSCWTPTFRSKAIIGLAVALLRIHEGIFGHRHFYPSSILLDANWNVKVDDLNYGRTDKFAVELTQIKESGDEQTFFCAPEIIGRGVYTSAIDIFSYGMIVYCLATGIQPSIHATQARDILPRMAQGDRPAIPDTTPRLLKELIEECWRAVPEQRASMAEVVLRLFNATADDLVDGTDMEKYKTYARSIITEHEHRLLGQEPEPDMNLMNRLLADLNTPGISNGRKLRCAVNLGEIPDRGARHQAFKVFNELAGRDSPVALGALLNKAECLFGGKGVRKDPATALDLYQQIVNMPDHPEWAQESRCLCAACVAKAHCRIGWIYDFGLAGMKDEARAVEHYRISASMGYPKGHLALGRVYQQKGEAATNPDEAERDFQVARRELEAANEKKEPSVGTFLARLLLNGQGGPQEVNRAVELLNAEANNPKSKGCGTANYNLGCLYKDGLYGYDVDIDMAVEYFQKAITEQYPPAGVALCELLAERISEESDEEKAKIRDYIANLLYWLSRAGDADQVLFAAEFLWEGKAEVCDPVTAVRYLVSCKAKTSKMCTVLAQWLRTGKGDVAPDPAEAQKWEDEARLMAPGT